ncbi:MAG: hypothetical protein Fur0024_0220 [Patescibacteria group bacterium]
MAKELSDINFIETIYKTQTEKTLIVVFVADMSSSSVVMLNYLEKIQTENEKFSVFYCNIDSNPTVRKQENLQIVPSVGVFRNGKRENLIEKFFTPQEFLVFLQNIK